MKNVPRRRGGEERGKTHAREAANTEEKILTERNLAAVGKDETKHAHK